MPYPVFHFTHRGNLASILAAGGLHCDSHMIAQATHAIVGNQDIKNMRTTKAVPVAAGGVVADYVPFYYAPRSPMLYSIFRGNVPNCTHPQTDLIYLVADASSLFQAHTCCFSDRNAAKRYATFSDQPQQLKTLIDWPLMAERYWKNSSTDLERVERRMAEFLVYQFVPWGQVTNVAVYDAQNLRYVHAALAGQQHTPPVAVQRDWYF